MDKNKTCKSCNKVYPLCNEYFYVDNNRSDGFSRLCKTCMFGKNNENFNFHEWYYKKADKFRARWDYAKLKMIYDNYHELDKNDILEMFPNEKYKTITNIIYQWNIRKVEKNDDWSEEQMNFLIKKLS